ncbi:Uncharacterised protein [uncultured archaeon]|nr:Uncharacterised protein [uncultured archaeon]
MSKHIENIEILDKVGLYITSFNLKEIVDLFEKDGNLKKWLKDKVTAAIVDKNPYYLP